MDRSNFAAEWCQNRNNTVAVPGSEWPNPITRPFDTETDSDPTLILLRHGLFGQALARGYPKRSSDPDGEVSRRDRRGRRGVLGGGKRDLHRSRFQQLPWSTESVSLKITPKK
ncbi:MAG: hypothetical protein ACOX52_24090 [Verrucomicrobiota bacterium]